MASERESDEEAVARTSGFGAEPAGEADRRLRARLAGAGLPLLLDGATGTELERAGVRTGLPLWSTHALLEAPEQVRAIHAAYARVGAEILTANTFRTQRRTLARAGLDDRDEALTRLAVALARDAARQRPGEAAWVAGSLPPLEDCYRSDLVPDEASLEREHGRQAELLAGSGVDLVLIETMGSVREACAAARAVSRTDRPFVVSFVSWRPGVLLSGEALATAARAVLDLGALAVGVNCVPGRTLHASRCALEPLDAALLVSPNLGQPDDETGFRRDEDVTAEAFTQLVEPWLDGATRLVGGCCGTTPAHIAALARRLARAPGPPSSAPAPGRADEPARD
ncbi:MAG: homocysteine S-methyltransferase family protein [Myxococcota bacterium]